MIHPLSTGSCTCEVSRAGRKEKLMSDNADIVGIDLGTTQSLIGVVEAGFPILLADETGSRMTRSVVYYGTDGAEAVVGGAAWRQRVVEGERTVVSVKRLMGRRDGEGESDGRPEEVVGAEVRAGSDGSLGVVVDGIWRSPVEVSAAI